MWVLGAVCPETGRAEGLLSPRLNTTVVNVFLQEFSQTLGDDEHAVMIWDGAVLKPELMKTICSASYLKRADSD